MGFKLAPMVRSSRGLLTLFLVACTTVAQAQSPPLRPNVVVLVADDLGTLDLGCYGSADLLTPNLDALAARGTKLMAAYAHAVCCPSRAALLTGRHPQRAGINDWVQGDAHGGVRPNNMPLGEVTLAEVVKPLGYRTALFGKWHVGGSLEHGPQSQGFDEYLGLRNGFIDNYSHYYLHGAGYHDLWDGPDEVFSPGEYFPEMITARAVDFVERAAEADEPFLLYVGFSLPHYPEQPLPRFDSLYAHLPEPRRSYAATVSTVDAHAGRILDAVAAAGLTDSTLVVFVSDNGHSAERYTITTPDHPSGPPRNSTDTASCRFWRKPTPPGPTRRYTSSGRTAGPCARDRGSSSATATPPRRPSGCPPARRAVCRRYSSRASTSPLRSAAITPPTTRRWSRGSRRCTRPGSRT